MPAALRHPDILNASPVRLELIPVIIAVVVGLLGIALIVDAWTPDDTLVSSERRRAPRLERSRAGEAILGFGVLGMAAAFAGRDTWAYSVVSVIAGTALLLIGTWANRRFLGAMIGHRGALRRRDTPPTDNDGGA